MGCSTSVAPPGEMAGNGVHMQHPLEVGHGVEQEAGGGAVTGFWGRYS